MVRYIIWYNNFIQNTEFSKSWMLGHRCSNGKGAYYNSLLEKFTF